MAHSHYWQTFLQMRLKSASGLFVQTLIFNCDWAIVIRLFLIDNANVTIRYRAKNNQAVIEMSTWTCILKNVQDVPGYI